MRKFTIIFIAIALGAGASAQKPAKMAIRKADIVALVNELSAKVDSLNAVIATLQRETVHKREPIDSSWEKWSDVRYNYGFNTSEQPVYNTIDGVLESTAMLSVRGGRGRWNSNTAVPRSIFVDGGHVFEGWNASETCRLTMLIGKQASDIACIQVYSPKGLYRTKRHFGWVKLGSDDADEGVDFGRRWAKSFVPFTLAAMSETPTDTMYENSQLGSIAVPVGTLYYDTVVGKVRCFTEEGWKYLSFE